MTYSSWQPPFSYSGGKSQLATRIAGMFRKQFPNENHFVSPFLGGAAVELRCMHAWKWTCNGADSDPHVILLWKWLLEEPRHVAECAAQFMPIDVETWKAWYSDMMTSDWHTLAHAAKYFILRYTRVVHAWNCWEDRLINFNQPKVHLAAFQRLSHFRAPRLAVERADFRDFLNENDGICYIDSPYVSDDLSYEKVYEKRQAEADNIFSREDHEALADILCARRTGWIASNSPHDWVRERYRDYQQVEVNVTYASRSAQQKRNRDTELLIISPLNSTVPSLP